jgi:hypothetical protein
MDDAWRERSRQMKSQFEARDALTELFLTRKIVVTYSDEEERDRLNAERMQEAKQQHEQIEQILEPCGSWDAGAIIHLIEQLQHKAENMISDARVLGMTTEPSILLQYGISKDDVDKVIAVHEHIRKVKDDEYTEVKINTASNAGKRRHEKEEEMAISDLTPLYERFISPDNKMLNVKGKVLPRDQWGAETFCKFCEEAKAGYGKKMLKKVYKALSSTA